MSFIATFNRAGCVCPCFVSVLSAFESCVLVWVRVSVFRVCAVGICAVYGFCVRVVVSVCVPCCCDLAGFPNIHFSSQLKNKESPIPSEQ